MLKGVKDVIFGDTSGEHIFPYSEIEDEYFDVPEN